MLVDQIRHARGDPATLQFEPTAYAGSILIFPILAYLPLAFDAGDWHFNADNAFQLSGNVVVRCVTNAPRHRTFAFLLAGEFVQMCSKPLGILDNTEWAMRVYNRVVPRRNNPAMLFLGGVPRRRYVIVGALEDSKNINCRMEVFPKRICAGNVPS